MLFLSPDQCKEIIKRKVSDVETSDIEQNTNGQNCLVFIVRKETVFRFPINDESREHLIREINFLSIFSEESPLPVPQLSKHIDTSGLLYCTYPYITGDTFREDWVSTFSDKNRLKIACQLGEFLSILHNFPQNRAKKMGIEEVDVYKKNVVMFSEAKRRIFPIIEDSEKEWIEKLYTGFLESLTPFPYTPRVCHSDFMPKHILVNREEEAIQGIIDFGYISIDDPANDFTFFNLYGSDFLEEGYRHYTLTRDDHFEERRRFYEMRHILTDLKSAVMGNNIPTYINAKKYFSQYVLNNPL